MVQFRNEIPTHVTKRSLGQQARRKREREEQDSHARYPSTASLGQKKRWERHRTQQVNTSQDHCSQHTPPSSQSGITHQSPSTTMAQQSLHHHLCSFLPIINNNSSSTVSSVMNISSLSNFSSTTNASSLPNAHHARYNYHMILFKLVVLKEPLIHINLINYPI